MSKIKLVAEAGDGFFGRKNVNRLVGTSLTLVATTRQVLAVDMPCRIIVPPMNVSPQLASAVLGAHSTACPHSGTLPKLEGEFRTSREGWGFRSPCPVYDECDVCGYENRHFTWDPKDEEFHGSTTSGRVAHPYVTYTTAERTSATITDASYTNGVIGIAPPKDDSTIIFWSPRKMTTSASRNAEMYFPDAKIIGIEYQYIVLKQEN